MLKYTEYSCEEFLEKLASAEPVPGGGGASALAGAIAAALTSMVGNLTVNKEKFSHVQEEMVVLLACAKKASNELLGLVEADANVFSSFMECYKLPKATEKEQIVRTEKIQKAAKIAAEVPFSIAEETLKVLKLADQAAKFGNEAVITDAAVAALLGRAALRSALYNVRINLDLIKDCDYCQTLEKKMLLLDKEARQLEESTLEKTNNVLGKNK